MTTTKGRRRHVTNESRQRNDDKVTTTDYMRCLVCTIPGRRMNDGDNVRQKFVCVGNHVGTCIIICWPWLNCSALYPCWSALNPGQQLCKTADNWQQPAPNTQPVAYNQWLTLYNWHDSSSQHAKSGEKSQRELCSNRCWK